MQHAWGHVGLLVGTAEGKTPLDRWVDNIKMDLRDWMGWYWLD
jgi:hypothetical protein